MNQPPNPPTDQPLRIAVWCAVSSKPQAAQDKTSLPDQEAAGRKFAAAIGGHVVRVYTVPGHTRDVIFWSDAEAAMDAYRQLRLDCQAHTFDVLFALDPDRLGRDPALSNQVISLVEKSGAEVYLASAPHPIGQATIGHRYVYAIQTVRAQEDQITRTRHSARGMRARVRHGLPANHWPIGYLPVRDARGETTTATLDPDLAPAVQLATRLFLAGEPYSHIISALDHSPYHPPRARRWGYSTVHRILHNDTYAGLPTWGDARPPQPSDRYPALWPPDTHAAIVRERARRSERRNRRSKSTGSPLAGVVFCARCGYIMTRHRHHHNYSTYSLRCSKHNRKSITGQPCHPNYVSERAIVQAITGYLATLTDPAGLDHALTHVDDTAPLQEELAAVEHHLDDLATRRHRLALALAAGHVDPQIYRAADDQLLEDVLTLEAQRQHLQTLLAAAPDLAARRAALEALIPIFPDLIHHTPAPRIRTLLQNAGLRVECEAGAITSIRLT